MCWIQYTKNGEQLQKIEATEDIHVFKVALVKRNGDVIPYYIMGSAMRYKEGQTFQSDLDEPDCRPYSHAVDKLSYYVINLGLHSYSTKKCMAKVGNMFKFSDPIVDSTVNRIRVYTIKDGALLNGFTLKCYNNEKLAIMDCSIPKGAFYYENNFGEIVSDTIRIDKITVIEDNTTLPDDCEYKFDYQKIENKPCVGRQRK